MSWVKKNGSYFYLHEGETLLKGLIRTNHQPNFECTQGYCGACKLRICVLSGNFCHTLPPLCHLESDEILACCCIIEGAVEIVD